MDGENKGKPENPIKMDDLGVPLFLETSIYYIYWDVLLVVRINGCPNSYTTQFFFSSPKLVLNQLTTPMEIPVAW